MNRFRKRPAQQANRVEAEPVKRKRGFSISASTKRSLMIVAVLVVLFLFAAVTAPFWINWLWFGSMGYRDVLVKTYLAQGISFVLAAFVAAFLFLTNVKLALRNSQKYDMGTDGKFGQAGIKIINWAAIIGAAVLAFFAGRYFASRWEEVMLFLNAQSFGVDDPTFNRDVGFYVFQVPFFRTLETTLIALLAITIVAVLVVYLLRMGFRFRQWGDVPRVAIRHITGLISALLLVMALGYLLGAFELVHSSRGVVNGPGFTDTNIVRPLMWIMAAMSLFAAIFLLTGFAIRNAKWFFGVIGVWLIASFVLMPVLPAAFQRFVVEPSEFRREQGYIGNNIQMTRAGFGLDEVQMVDLTGQEDLVPSELDTAPGGELSNVRVWDYRVVGPVYKQIQTFVPFYEFPDVDVDRYEIEGETVQVLVGVRELNLDGLAPGRQTWTNRHLVYTHGYGYVISPVSAVNRDGWTSQVVSGIPMEGPAELLVENPQVYFGENDLQWVILFTNRGEIAGLQENSDDSEGFQGTVYGSVGLGNPVTRAMAALTLGDRNVFFTGELTGDSRLVQTRNVVERAERIAPFLEYDEDPYMVIADGRMKWVIDAYTETDMYPHATRYEGRNYMRNSVKVVVDAYSGETTFYRTEVNDPIADAWASIYPDLFTPVSEAPESLTAHFRYPEMLFSAQTQVWGDYHMDDARTSYEGDDRWEPAKEASDEENKLMEPYFVNQQLPGDDVAGFWLTIPFTPAGERANENMTAWLAGSADTNGTTDLRLYRYPRDEVVYGPRQVEAMIDQNPEISQQITLWGQGGSEVIRGNMLVIPVDNAMLYVQPIYLQATGTNASAPTLARVIVVANGQVVMRPTLAEAMDALADPDAGAVDAIVEDPDEAVQQAQTVDATPVAADTTQQTSAVDRSQLPPDLANLNDEELAQEAQASLERLDQARVDQDGEAYNAELERLQLILEALSGGESTPQPESTPAN